MRVANVIPYIGRAQGGPVFGLACYSIALAGAGCEVSILCSPRGTDGEAIEFDPRVRVRTFENPRWGAFRHCPELGHALAETRCDVIHSHGLWTDAHRSAAVQAKRRSVPHVLAPCGMLAPAALQRCFWKKVPVQIWFQEQALHQAACLHAKSELEYQHIRRLGLLNPVCIVPNPVELRFEPGRNSSEAFRRSIGSDSKRILLFLGRLHPVKGIPRLIEAWANLREYHDRWQIVLAGPDELDNRQQYETLAHRRGCARSITFTGQLDGARKSAAYGAADLFVMPSDFENFGNAIVEAMLAGLPVITTTGTPWKELPTQGIGWCIEPKVGTLALALREALEMPEKQRVEMGHRAAHFAKRFSPKQAAADLIQVYSWLLGKGPRPECVRLH